MNSSNKRIFFHDKNRVRNRYDPHTPEFEVAEIVYECFLELAGVGYAAANKAFPKAERDKNPTLNYAWETAHQQIKEFLTRYKNIVKDAVIPLVKLTKHKTEYDDSQDRHTQEFKKLIVDNNYKMLYEKLKDFAPMLLPEEDVEPFNKVLDITYPKVREKLLSNLAVYEAEGRYSEEDWI
jgi:vacuolar-type H+-ATPase subunit H